MDPPQVNETTPSCDSEQGYNKKEPVTAEKINTEGKQDNGLAHEAQPHIQSTATGDHTATIKETSTSTAQEPTEAGKSDGQPAEKNDDLARSTERDSMADVADTTSQGQAASNNSSDPTEEKLTTENPGESDQKQNPNEGSPAETADKSPQTTTAQGLPEAPRVLAITYGSRGGTASLESTETTADGLLSTAQGQTISKKTGGDADKPPPKTTGEDSPEITTGSFEQSPIEGPLWKIREKSQGQPNNNDLQGNAVETPKTTGGEPPETAAAEKRSDTKSGENAGEGSPKRTGEKLPETAAAEGLAGQPSSRQTTNTRAQRKFVVMQFVEGPGGPSASCTQGPLTKGARDNNPPAAEVGVLAGITRRRDGDGVQTVPGGENDGSDPSHVQGQQGATAEPAEAAQEDHYTGWHSGDPPVVDTVAICLRRWHSRTPEHPALVFIKEGAVDAYGRRNKTDPFVLTCTSLYALSVAFAHKLIVARGIGRGDVVCNTLPNCPERAVADLGIILAGAVLLNAPRHVDTNQQLSRFCDYLVRLDVKLVVYARTDPFSRLVVWRARESPDIELYMVHIDGDSPGFPGLLSELNNVRVNRLREAEAALPENVYAGSVCLLWPTPGRHGFYPKVVAHSHESVLRVASQFQRHLVKGISSDVYYSSGNLGDMYGFPGMYLVYGRTTLVESRSYCVPDEWEMDYLALRAIDHRPPLSWNTLIGYGCTTALFTTRDLERYQDTRAISKHFCKSRLKSLAVVGDVVKGALVRKLLSTVASHVRAGYCMAELGLVAHCQQPAVSDVFQLVKAGLAGRIHVRSVQTNTIVTYGTLGTLEIIARHVLAGVRSGGGRGGQLFLVKRMVLTEDLVSVFNDKLRLVGRLDRRLMRTDKPNFIREVTEYVLRHIQGVADAALVVVTDTASTNASPVLVACLVAEDDSPRPTDSYCHVTSRCRALINRISCWAPDEYRFFDALAKSPAGWLHRKALAQEVERARGLYLSYDFHAHMQQRKEEQMCRVL